MGDYSDWVNYIDDGYIDDTVIWSVRDQLTPPEKDYVMWSSSGWETNIEYLIEDMGLEEDEIRLVRYSGHTSCWIPRKHSPYTSDKVEEEE
tara:strand:- start:425 stop:697 length:273 start_codon:yes stop_codon:yes gene_type:complete